MSLKITLPFQLTSEGSEHPIMARLEVSIKVSQEQKLLAGAFGYGAEELGNLVDQRTQELAADIAGLIGESYTGAAND